MPEARQMGQLKDAQDFNIPLNSPLEAVAEHTVVPASRPTFAYNPQVPISGMLSNTIKYEGPGIFCGKHRYEYGVKYTYPIDNIYIDKDRWGELLPEFTVTLPDGTVVPKISDEDILRNFYWYDEKEYAIDVTYPRMTWLRRLSFVTGFFMDNYLPGAIGDEIKVIRTNSKSLGDDNMLYEAEPEYVNGDPEEDVLVSGEGPDKYIISGKTHLKGLPARIVSDVYERRLLPYINAEAEAEYTAYVPENYSASMTWNADDIAVDVVHDTSDKDNVVVVMPQINLNETASDLSVDMIKYGDGLTTLVLDSEDTSKNIDIGVNTSLGKGLQFDVVSQTRTNEGTVNEQDELYVVNNAVVYPTERYAGDPMAGHINMAITTRTVPIAVSRFDGTGAGSVYSVGLTEAVSALTKVRLENGSEVSITQVRSNVISGTFGRPAQSTPHDPGRIGNISYIADGIGVTPAWGGPLGQNSSGMQTGALRVVCSYGTWLETYGQLPSQTIYTTFWLQDVYDRGDPLWDDYQGARTKKITETMDAMYAFRDQLRAQYGDRLWSFTLHNDNVYIPGTFDNGQYNHWHFYMYSVHVLTGDSMGATGQYSWQDQQITVECSNIEAGIWTVTEESPPTNPTWPFRSLVGVQAVVSEDLRQIVVPLAVATRSTTVRTAELGIVINIAYDTVDVIDSVTFKDSGKTTFIAKQGEQRVPVEVSYLSPWDFANSLVYADGVTPVSSGDVPDMQAPEPPESDYPAFPEDYPAWVFDNTWPPASGIPLPTWEDMHEIPPDVAPTPDWVDMGITLPTEPPDPPSWTDLDVVPPHLPPEDINLWWQRWLDDPANADRLQEWRDNWWPSEWWQQWVVYHPSEMQAWRDAWTVDVWWDRWLTDNAGAVTAWQNRWMEDNGVALKRAEYLAQWIDDWKNTWLDNASTVASAMNGMAHRQIFEITARGLSPTEVVTTRYVVRLPVAYNNNDSLSRLNIGYRISSYYTAVSGHVASTGRDFAMKYGLSTIYDDGSGTGLPGEYVWSMVVVPGGVHGSSGAFDLVGVHDDTARRLQVRRMFLSSADGFMRGTTLVSTSGFTDNVGIALDVPQYGRQSLIYSNGLFTWDAPHSTEVIELVQVSEYIRSLQYSDGTYATLELLPHEMLLIIVIVTTDSEEVALAGQDVLHLMEIRRTPEQVEWVTYNSVLGNDIDNILAMYRAWYATGVDNNSSAAGGVFRLVYRDADKIQFKFLPRGMFRRAVPTIAYNSIRLSDTGITTIFDYVRADTGELVENAEVTVGFEGSAYIQCDAHDPMTGHMKSLPMADPDTDYAILTHRVDTDLEVLNMWWVDEDTVMQETTYQFVCIRKDDNGVWSTLAAINKDEYIPAGLQYCKYGVTSANESTPYFYVVEPATNGVRVRLRPLDRVDDTVFTNSTATGRERLSPVIVLGDLIMEGFSVKGYRFLGGVPSPELFINNVSITSTRIGNRVLMGMVYDKGVHQWTTVFQVSGANKYSVFTGYGCVGLDGTVTGGAWPMFAMNQLAGASVLLVTQPDAETDQAFKRSRTAFVDGQRILFMDGSFTGGICTYAKWIGSLFKLTAIPLGASRTVIKYSGKNQGLDVGTGAMYLPLVNVGAMYVANQWAWINAVHAVASNVWHVDVFSTDNPLVEVKLGEHGKDVITATDSPDAGFRWARGITGVAVGMSVSATKLLKQTSDVLVANQRATSSSIGEGFGKGYNPWQSVANMYRAAIGIRGGDGIYNSRGTTTEELTPTPSYARHIVLDTVPVVLNEMITEISQVDNVGVTVGIASLARLGTSSLYAISPTQNVFAGPGFVQVHLAQGNHISGSYAYSCAAKGNGVVFGIPMPPIPIPMVGTLDLNNQAALGTHPLDTALDKSNGNMVIQPRINAASKHIVYSYPTSTQELHEISETRIVPKCEAEHIDIYHQEFHTINMSQGFTCQKLAYDREEVVRSVLDNCSIVQGIDRTYTESDKLDLPITTDTGYPGFTPAASYDFCVYAPAELYFAATNGVVTSTSVRDTVVMDGAPSNVLIKGGLPFLSSAYACVEVSNQIKSSSVRPFVVSADLLAYNTTGVNLVKGLQSLHGFDAYTNRILSMVGGNGPDNEVLAPVFQHVEQGPVKVGNILPPQSYFGNFSGPPLIAAYPHKINVYSAHMNNVDKSAENLVGFRYSIPMVHKSVSLLPAMIHTLAPYKLHVVDGVTSLTTPARLSNPKMKTPMANDFAIYGQPYRVNSEYISKLTSATGTVYLQDVIASLGMKYLGATPKQAWFYAQPINAFFVFTGSDTLERAALVHRFISVDEGTWDFVSQEVVFKTFIYSRPDLPDNNPLVSRIKDIVRMSDGFSGLVYPPNHRIVDEDGDFKLHGMAGGLVAQGDNRGQMYRYILQDMLSANPNDESVMFREIPGFLPSYVRALGKANDGVIVNHGLWDKVKGRTAMDFWSERKYGGELDDVYGYYLEPFKLATSFLGIDEATDCLFEWELNFAMTTNMARLLGNKYVTVFLASETLTPGGVTVSDVTNVYLKVDMFQRERIEGAVSSGSSGEHGYYSFRYNGRNGAGNGEKLYCWSDGGVVLRGLKVSAQKVTGTRTTPLVTQIDVSQLEEL